MREIRLYGSEGGGAARSPYPYLSEPCKGDRNLAQGRARGRSRSRRPGSAFRPFSPLPPNPWERRHLACFLRPGWPRSQRFGGRGWERGAVRCGAASLTFRCLPGVVGTKREFRESRRVCPLTLTLSPNTKNVLGERGQRVRIRTQGAASGSCRWLCPGLLT